MASRDFLAMAAACLLLGCLPAATADDGVEDAMIELAWDSGCFNCHDVDEQVRGPSWRAVAERYRGDEDAYEQLVTKVIEGGGGVWGDDVMSANRRVPEEDVRELVAWLLTLE
jgi:cytochrome c